jgi:hypothetical protein
MLDENSVLQANDVRRDPVHRQSNVGEPAMNNDVVIFCKNAMAFPPPSSIALTTAEAALESFAYVMATLAPSEARRFAIAAPIPREPPVTSATFFANLDKISFAFR